MDTPYENTPVTGEASEVAEEKIVYVREVLVEDLPRAMQDKAGDLAVLYSVNDEEGQRLALVADRGLAFSLARQHDYAPVSVH